MALLVYFHAILLGILEGLTEFIPVSSTGHLILGKELLGFTLPSANMFIVVIQLGAILAVCWLYRKRLLDIACNLQDKKQQSFVMKMIVAFLPAAIIGLSFNHAIEEHLFSPLIVATTLIIGGIIIWVVEKFKPAPTTHNMDDISLKQAFWLGCAQAVAIIPGTSRSGATIIGGLLLKLDRKAATEFSFFMAIPVMLAATLLDIVKYRHSLSLDDIGVMTVGFIVSFLSGMLAVKVFLKFVARHDFIPFAIYRIILGLIMLAYFLPG